MKKVIRLYEYSTIVFVSKASCLTIFLFIFSFFSFAHAKGFLDQKLIGLPISRWLDRYWLEFLSYSTKPSTTKF